MKKWTYAKGAAFPFGGAVKDQDGNQICLCWDDADGEKIAEALNLLEKKNAEKNRHKNGEHQR